MTAERLDARADADRACERAAEIILKGGVIAAPTDTVFGFCCLADDEVALDRIRAVKGQAREKPFQILVADADAARGMCVLSPAAERLAAAYWPGPMTLVLPDGAGGTAGLRAPDHDATLRLLRATARPVAATSVNRHGEPPARSAAEVVERFGAETDAVLDDGSVSDGVSSTVARVDGDTVEILREGVVPAERVFAVAGGVEGRNDNGKREAAS